MESTVHQLALETLCRLCATPFKRDRPSTKRESVKYLCLEERYKCDIEKYFNVTIKSSDPKYVCQACLAYMRCNLKKGQHCKKFIKRLWQDTCSPACDTCEIYLMKTKPGKPSQKLFQTNYITPTDPHVNYLQAIKDDYGLSCGICCSFIGKHASQLPCGHVECPGCSFTCSDEVKCSKCCKVCTSITAMPDPVYLNLPCMCRMCRASGSRDMFENHRCDVTKPNCLNMTISELLSASTSHGFEAASQVASTWISKLADHGKLVIPSSNGKVIKNVLIRCYCFTC